LALDIPAGYGSQEYWLKNRSAKWASPILEVPEGDDSRRHRLLHPYFENAKPNQVVAIGKAREPARILVAIGEKNNDRPHLEYKQRWVDQFQLLPEGCSLGTDVRAPQGTPSCWLSAPSVLRTSGVFR
jgi:hypothetical protein